jgi:glucose-1-phosphate cytidylyltransferase
MKCVILAGGLGSRLSEETDVKPKPMVEIGGYPIIWHIMKIYTYYGINDFIICLGYKGYVIKDFFLKYRERLSDITINLPQNAVTFHRNLSEPWKITLVDTGEKTMTGGRLRRIARFLGDDDFCCTYGDGLADINIDDLIQAHRASGCLATVTAVRPPGRFGALEFAKNQVIGFKEKPAGDGAWINGGFFVLSPEVLSLVEDDETIWEQEPMQALVKNGHLNGYFHTGFWHPMDTLRDKRLLENLWLEGAPWKIWENELCNEQIFDPSLSIR